jgi:hypothetical protein
LATSFGKDIIEIVQEDRVLKGPGAIQYERQTVELAYVLVGERGEGKG